MPAKREYKLDLFPLLRNISTKNVGYYDSLSEEAIKEFTPFVLMRWLTGCNDGNNLSARQIFFLNELVNPYAFEFHGTVDKNHKKLLYNLMTICTSGRDCRYKFNKTKGKNTSELPKALAVIKEVFGYNNKDAHDAIALLSDEAIIDMAEQGGMQEAEIKLLKKELKTKRPR
jgi:hypothetical protein